MADYRSLIVTEALKYMGTTEPSGDDQFIKAYNKTVGTTFNMETPWCAMFVTYCARMAGVPTTIIPNFASCTVSRDSFFKPKGQWKLRTTGYTPKPGDLIYYNWDGNMSGPPQHVGLVWKVENGNVITIEGNTSDSSGKTKYDGVFSKTRALNYKCILAYAAPAYPANAAATNVTETKVSTMVKNTHIANFQTWLNNTYKTNLKVDGECGPDTKKAAVKAWQTYVNATIKAGLSTDGNFGSSSKVVARNNSLILRSKSKNNSVWILQGILYCQGYDPKGLDGEVGPNTILAVKAFQKARKLEVDGEVGPETWDSLFNKW